MSDVRNSSIQFSIQIRDRVSISLTIQLILAGDNAAGLGILSWINLHATYTQEGL